MPHLDNCSFSARRDKMGLAPDTVKLLFSLEVMDKRRAGYLLQAEYPVVRIGGIKESGQGVPPSIKARKSQEAWQNNWMIRIRTGCCLVRSSCS